ncbi:MAG: pyrimidine reductase family protein [Acidimicrobiales bacterium]|nr:pyrimidine reductase family protein [Acidimicrobiales bacterium]
MLRLRGNGSEQLQPVEAVAAELRRPHRERPWVLVNMIGSVDGATDIDGHSGGLGSAADRELFRALRAVADLIVVGAGTVRAEDYGPPSTTDSIRSQRLDRGQAPDPRLVIVSSRLDLSPQARVFSDPDHRPLIATHQGAPSSRRSILDAVADVIDVGRDAVDLGAMLAHLHADGARVVVCEGGPTLNASLFGADLVDELCLTVAPIVVGGSSPRVVDGAGVIQLPFRLDRVFEEDSYLFLRYLRDRSAA